MSNPCINRWGLNAVWHHFWYSDTSYNINLQHDKLILELIHIYLNYGSNYSSRMFWNPFWYKSSNKPSFENFKHYYRWIPIYSDVLRSTSTYQFRLVSDERFNTRINILKYNSWIILNLYWFQPDKGLKRRLRMAKLRRHTLLSSYNQTSLSNVTKVKKLITLNSTYKPSTWTNYTF